MAKKPIPQGVLDGQAALEQDLARPVEVKAMFGGFGLRCKGVMIAGWMPDDHDQRHVMLRVDEQSQSLFEAAGGETFVYRREGKAVRMPYRSLPAAIMEAPEALRPFAEQALRAAQAAKR